ncbi:MAG: ribosomal protein L7/L12 [Myxococcota bacterium]
MELVRYPDSRRIAIIKQIRQLTGLGLKEALQLSESLPAVLVEDENVDRLRQVARQFEAGGRGQAGLPVLGGSVMRPVLEQLK